MNKRPHAKPRGLAAFLPSRTDGLRLSVRPKIAYAISNDAIDRKSTRLNSSH